MSSSRPPSRPPDTASPARVPPFEDHCRDALDGLRASLTELYHAAGADPDAPQEVARRFGFNRNLSWKVARILRVEDPFAVFQHLPGAAGLNLLADAFEQGDAPAERVSAVRAAVAELERMVELHAGDRKTLEIMLDSLGHEDAGGQPLVVSRKLAFEGNSGILGIQAALRLRAVFLAPDADDPALLDIAQVSGLLGLRRFRHGAAWPLFLQHDFDDDGTHRENVEHPLDPDTPDRETMLMREFCSRPLPEIRSIRVPGGRRYEQVGGELGKRGASHCVYGGYRRAFAPRYRDDKNVRGEFFTWINAPVERLLFDVVLHRDLLEQEFQLRADVLYGDASTPYFERSAVSLPSPERLRSLGPGAPRVATPAAPRYPEIVERVFQRLEWDPAEFRGFRYELAYPPLPSTVVLGYELPQRA